MIDSNSPGVGTVDLKETPALTVAAVRASGPFDEIRSVLMDLFRWVLSEGGNVTSYPMALFPEIPGEQVSEEGIFEVCLPVGDDTSLEGREDVRIYRLPPVTVAFCRHYGSLESADETYDLLLTWTANNGFSTMAPAREIYLTNPMETEETAQVTEIQVPVEKGEQAVH
jgi:effector-binding domain-containing protein